jgi:drug/metabolite transporter (DMT)-like permease
MKKISVFVLFLNPALWASFYAISKLVLLEIDPVVFLTMELTIACVPAGIVLLFLRDEISLALVRIGLILGFSLFLAVVGSTTALYFTTATNTAFFPALNGAFATALLWYFSLEPMRRLSEWAVALSSFGALLVILFSAKGGGTALGDFIALSAAMAYTAYIFAVDHFAGSRQSFSPSQLMIIGCVEITAMALLGWFVFMLMGYRVSDVTLTSQVVYGAAYVGLFTTFLPTMIATSFQRYVPPVTVALIYIIEPVLGAVAAYFIIGETLALPAYIGGGFIVAASFLNVLSSFQSEKTEKAAD